MNLQKLVENLLLEVIKVLFSLGMMVTKMTSLKQDELEILGEEFGIEVTVKRCFRRC